MTCTICGRNRVWHGSSEPGARPGTYLMEMGCHEGVAMDDDVHAEGWDPGAVYPPCKHNPNRCPRCGGSGDAPPDVTDRDDCPDCGGNGWRDGNAQWPASGDGEAESAALCGAGEGK